MGNGGVTFLEPKGPWSGSESQQSLWHGDRTYKELQSHEGRHRRTEWWVAESMQEQSGSPGAGSMGAPS